MARVFYDKKSNVIAFHPGYYIQDMLEEEPDIKEILLKGLGEKTLDGLIEGTVDVDRELAKSLEICTGVSKSTWLSLQKSYNEKIDNKKELSYDSFTKDYIAAAKDIPVLITIGVISLFPILFIPAIICLFFAPYFLHVNTLTTVVYYVVLVITLPLFLMAANKLKHMFKDTIKFLADKLNLGKEE